MNSQRLLDQFLGPQMGAAAESKLQSAAGYLSSQGAKAGLVGVAGGGLLGLLVGNKKARKTAANLAGGIVGYGGAAALGAMAFSAYQRWQGQRTSSANNADQNVLSQHPNAATHPNTQTPAENPEALGADGRPFQLALVKALIAAANADGHICETERRAIMTHLSALALASDEKMFVYDALMAPSSVLEIAQLAKDIEQAAEIYLVSRMFIDPDDPIERAYLDELAHHLGLPQELVSELEAQAQGHDKIAA